MSNIDDAVNALSNISDDSAGSTPSAQPAEQPVANEPSYPSEVITPTGQAVQLGEGSGNVHQANISGIERNIL